MMAKHEQTSKTVAGKAAKILRNPRSSRAIRSIAASALTQARPRRRRR